MTWGWLLEIRGAVHHTEKLDHALNAIERTEIVFCRSEYAQSDLTSGDLGGLQIHFIPHPTGKHGAIGQYGNVPGKEGLVAHHKHGLVDAALGRRGRQRKVHFGKFGFDAHK